MALRLKPNRPLPSEIRRVVDRRLVLALECLDGFESADPAEIEEAVFEVRKRCKQVRAIARSVRDPIGDEFLVFDNLIRKVAAGLAPFRDAQAILETVDDLRSSGKPTRRRPFDAMRTSQAELVEAKAKRLGSDETGVDRPQELLRRARESVQRWELPDDPAVLRGGIKNAYGAGKRDLRRAQKKATVKRLHDWRKSVKTLWYEIRLVERVSPSSLGPLMADLDTLSSILGEDHDLSMLIARLESHPKRAGGKKEARRVAKVARGQRTTLRKSAFRLGTWIYDDATNTFVDKVLPATDDWPDG